MAHAHAHVHTLNDQWFKNNGIEPTYRMITTTTTKTQRSSITNTRAINVEPTTE